MRSASLPSSTGTPTPVELLECITGVWFSEKERVIMRREKHEDGRGSWKVTKGAEDSLLLEVYFSPIQFTLERPKGYKVFIDPNNTLNIYIGRGVNGKPDNIWHLRSVTRNTLLWASQVSEKEVVWTRQS